MISVSARDITGTGAFESKGGNGFTPIVGNAGGGGAGGGGGIMVISETISAVTFDVSAGTPGAGIGNGTTGLAGAAGRSVSVRTN
jgi:hypothetical protein